MLKHIYVDERQWTCFDQYFVYIESIKEHLPADLYRFAADVSRYELDGPNTLHDAWVEDVVFSTRYRNQTNVIAAAEAKVCLRKANGRFISMTYSGVEGFEYRNLPNRWPDMATDLLVHEVCLESSSLYSHLLVFDKDVYMKLVFRNFRVEENAR
jgi:hypothetical protein